MQEPKIDGVIKLYNYERPNRLEISDEAVDSLLEIDTLGLRKTKLVLESTSKRKVVKNARKFMTRHFKLHKVPYKRFLSILDPILLSKIPYPKISVGLCNLTCINLHPFRIPVCFTNDGEDDNMVVSNNSLLHCEEYYKKSKIYYQSILLSKNVNELSESSYVHELTHTQLTKQRGINGEYYNEEVLPIFIEMVNIYESGSDYLWRGEDAIRITELLYYTSLLYNTQIGVMEAHPDLLLNNSLYATSIVKAYGLFIEYVNGTSALRKYIMRCIQNIFDAEMPLPELLDEFEIDFDSTLSERKLMKYLTR